MLCHGSLGSLLRYLLLTHGPKAFSPLGLISNSRHKTREKLITVMSRFTFLPKKVLQEVHFRHILILLQSKDPYDV